MPPTIFGAESKGDLRGQIDELNAKVHHLEGQLDDYRTRLLQADERLAEALRVGPIVDALEAELERRENSGEIMFGAEELARKVVLTQLIERRTEGLSHTIIQNRRKQIEAKYGPEWTKEQRRKLQEMYEQDGTFAQIDQEVDTEQQVKLSEEVKQDHYNTVLARYTSPEMVAQGKEVALKKLIESGDAAKIEAAIRELYEVEWREAAIQDAKSNYADKLEGQRVTFMTQFGDDWLASYEGQQFQAQARREAERRWERLSVEEKQEAIRDLVDKDLLREAAELQNERQRRDNEKERLRQTHEDLFADFERRGIDLDQIPDNTTITIQCGEVRRMMHPRYQGYSQREEYMADIFVLDREVTLVSHGDGTFTVIKDTQADSDNAAEVALSMQPDHVVTLGTAEKKTTDGRTSEALTKVLRRGSVFAFDDDPSTPQHITTGLYPVANVIIGDVSYLEITPDNTMPRSQVR